MGISECGTKLFSHVRSEVTLGEYSGKRLVVDVASFKLRAWYHDVPQYYRSSELQSHGYRAILSALCTLDGYRSDFQRGGLPGWWPLPA